MSGRWGGVGAGGFLPGTGTFLVQFPRGLALAFPGSAEGWGVGIAWVPSEALPCGLPALLRLELSRLVLLEVAGGGRGGGGGGGLQNGEGKPPRVQSRLPGACWLLIFREGGEEGRVLMTVIALIIFLVWRVIKCGSLLSANHGN